MSAPVDSNTPADQVHSARSAAETEHVGLRLQILRHGARGMMMHAPQWVREACKLWGRQKRRVWAGGDWHRDSVGIKRWHVDGYAESFFGRLLEDKIAAGHSEVRQHWPEVYWGEGLDVQRVMLAMPEHAHTALHLHYVFDPDHGVMPRHKAAYMRMTVNGYWLTVKRAEFLLWRRLDPLGANLPFAQVIDLNQKRCYKPPTKSRMAQLSLASLQRPKLSLKT